MGKPQSKIFNQSPALPSHTPMNLKLQKGVVETVLQAETKTAHHWAAFGLMITATQQLSTSVRSVFLWEPVLSAYKKLISQCFRRCRMTYRVRGRRIAWCEACFDSLDDFLVTSDVCGAGTRRSGSEANEENENRDWLHFGWAGTWVEYNIGKRSNLNENVRNWWDEEMLPKPSTVLLYLLSSGLKILPVICSARNCN